MNAGDFLFKIDDLGSSMFLVLSGKLTCTTRDGVEVKVIAPGALTQLWWVNHLLG